MCDGGSRSRRRRKGRRRRNYTSKYLFVYCAADVMKSTTTSTMT